MGVFLCLRTLFLLPVPAKSQLNYGAEVNENDAKRHSPAAATELAVCAVVKPQRAAPVTVVCRFCNYILGRRGRRPLQPGAKPQQAALVR